MKKSIIFTTSGNVNDAKRNLAAIKNSKLDDEVKMKAERSLKNLTIFAIIMFIVILLTILVSWFVSETPFLLIVLSIVELIILIVGSFVIAKNYGKAARIVDMGFDGKSEEEINLLKPDQIDKKSISKNFMKEMFWGILMLVVLIGSIYLAMKYQNKIMLVIGIICAIVCYIFMDTYGVEQHRLKSGYYKKSVGYICNKCKKTVEMPFKDIEQYESLPKNEHGITLVKCPNCGNDVEFINLEISKKDYQKYLDNRNK